MGVFWNPATAIAAQVDADPPLHLALRQGCDGLFAGMRLACALLRTCHSRSALLVGSDRFWGTSFCPVTADYGIVYGDGAAAFTLRTDDGIARVIATETVTDHSLAAMHDGRGGDTHDVRSAKRRFLEIYGNEALKHATRTALASLNRKMNATVRDNVRVRHILLPHLGLDLLNANYVPAFSDSEVACQISAGCHLGHLGTVDQFAALDALRCRGELAAGDRVLLVGAGSGFCWTAALLEITPTFHSFQSSTTSSKTSN